MKAIQIREIITTGTAGVIVINPYLVRNIVFNLIKLQDFAQFIEGSKQFDQSTDSMECGMYVPVCFLNDIHNSVLPFLQQLDNAITNEDENVCSSGTACCPAEEAPTEE